MDEQRFQELMQKRQDGGLDDEEANELGKMVAEQEGRRYSNADTREHPQEDTSEEQPYSEAEVKELKQHPDVREDSEESEKPS